LVPKFLSFKTAVVATVVFHFYISQKNFKIQICYGTVLVT